MLDLQTNLENRLADQKIGPILARLRRCNAELAGAWVNESWTNTSAPVTWKFPRGFSFDGATLAARSSRLVRWLTCRVISKTLSRVRKLDQSLDRLQSCNAVLAITKVRKLDQRLRARGLAVPL